MLLKSSNALRYLHASPMAIVVFPTPVAVQYRESIIAAAAEQRLPAIYPYRFFAADGGLMSYGASPLDVYRGAASYADLILKGAKVAELPVQQPTKYELVINLKTAKSLGARIPIALSPKANISGLTQSGSSAFKVGGLRSLPRSIRVQFPAHRVYAEARP